MSLNHSPKIVTDGLVLCLDAGDPKSYNGSGTTWFDRSTTLNNGSLDGSPTFVNENGGVLNFASHGDAMYTSKTAAELGITDNNVTLEIMFKKAISPAQSSQGFFGFHNFNFKNTSNFFVSSVTSTDTVSNRTITPNIEGAWVSLAATYDGVTLKVYHNGEYKAQSNFTMKTIQNDTLSITGYGYYKPDAYYSTCRAYSRLLSDEELKENYNARKSRFKL